jgi:hypothetical protein
MVEHIKQLAVSLLDALQRTASPKANPFDICKALAAELEVLSSADFSPDVRAEFATVRAFVLRWAKLESWPKDKAPVAAQLNRLVKVLDGYGIQAKGARVFRWLQDADLRGIVERDYRELAVILLPAGAWKSTVITAGSILEAILVDLITKDPVRLAAAQASATAPKVARGGAAKPFDDWRLVDYIRVGADIALIPADREKTFDQVLRDYRNFVHPKKEIRAAHPCGEGEALLAKGGLDALCDHFDRTLP